jgi:hypothetical protein
MKKTMLFLIALAIVSTQAFAMAKKPASPKDKAYGNCLVAAPGVCGGSQSVDWSNPEAAQKFKDCTKAEQAKCWAIFTK